MIVGNPKAKSFLQRVNNVSKYLHKNLLIIIIPIVFFSLGLFSYPYIAKNKNKILNVFSLVSNDFYNFVFLESPKEFVIDIKYKNLEKIQKDRIKALKKGKLLSSKFVSAKIKYNNLVYDVKLRLKGDHLDHLFGEKWSFRIKTKGENTIMGMKRFSIQQPGTRNFLGEWIFHKALKDNGIIGLRYEFINVILNGKNLGIYAIEEHFEKRLLENNSRKDGPIIKFNENSYWEYHAITPRNKRHFGINENIYKNSIVDGYSRTDSLDANYKKAFSMLRSYRAGSINFNDIFDLELFAKHYAISRVFSAYHGEVWHNRRFYFNPITEKLEPIGFDADALTSSIEDEEYFNNNIFYHWMNSEKNNYELIAKIVFYLEKFSNQNFISNYHRELKYYERLLFSESFTYLDDYQELIENNQNEIKKFLDSPSSQIFSNCFYLNQTEDSITFKIANSNPWPVKVHSLVYKNKKIPINNVILPGKDNGGAINFFNFSISNDKIPIEDEDFSLEKSFFEKSIIGSSKKLKYKIYKWNYHNNFSNENLALYNHQTDLEEFDFLEVNDSNQIVFKNGRINISEQLFIPKGYKIIINENTTIDINNGSSIISYSPFYCLGTLDSKVTFQSSDSSGQGLFVLNNEEKSVFHYTEFINLSNPEKNSWSLTGAVTFYNADVELKNCNFINNIKGDDFLNIVKSNFLIYSTNFINVNADAIDSDFSSGSIINSSFYNCGNDAIDFSGSTVKVSNASMRKIGDKAVSAGENSSLEIENLVIDDAAIAICSKDYSNVSGKNIAINNSSIGVTAFQKKPEFGPSIINIAGLKTVDLEVDFLIESGSSCEIDGVNIKNSSLKKVKDILYGVQYGKASK